MSRLNSAMRVVPLSSLFLWTVATNVQSQPTGKTQEPILLGFEDGETGTLPNGWFVPTTGWSAELVDDQASNGQRSLKLHLETPSKAQFGNVMRAIDVQALKGMRIRLSAKVKVEGKGRAQMWVRVDRPNQQMGFFDNMGRRPITAGRWTDAVIEGDVDEDGVNLVCGFMSFGEATVFVDELELAARAPAVPKQKPSPPRPLSDRGLSNVAAATRLLSYVRFFHPSDEAMAVTAWDHFAVRLLEAAEPAKDAGALAATLSKQFAPIAPGLAVWAVGEEDQRRPVAGGQTFRYWVHRGAGPVAMEGSIYGSSTQRMKADDLGKTRGGSLLQGAPPHTAPTQLSMTRQLPGGVTIRLPVAVPLGPDGSIPKAVDSNPWTSEVDLPRLTAMNRSTRLASVAICWGVMQHFYPYFDVVETDWDEALLDALRQAATDPDERSFLNTVRALVAKLKDGHGHITARSLQPVWQLPIAIDWAGNDCTVVGVADWVRQIRAGDTILVIDGTPIADVCQKESQTISAATEGWRRTMLARSVPLRNDQDAVRLTLRRPDGTEYSTVVTPVGHGSHIKREIERPSNGAELAEGIIYFDLSGAEDADLEEALDNLRRARGIVFDLRGYPGSGAITLLRYLISEPATSAEWNVPLVTMPDREQWTWQQSSWDLRPLEKTLDANVAFLTNGQAISYAESIMGVVEHYKLGDIVGSTTAGTNGNVNPFILPGGYQVSWTGMKVLKHDGSRHHGVGIVPTVSVAPSAAGIAAGRDEVLAKAVEVLQKRSE